MTMNPLLAMMGGSLPPLGDLIKLPCAYCIALNDGTGQPIADAVTLYEGSLLCAPHVRSTGAYLPRTVPAGVHTYEDDAAMDELRESAKRAARTQTCDRPTPHESHLWTTPDDQWVTCTGWTGGAPWETGTE